MKRKASTSSASKRKKRQRVQQKEEPIYSPAQWVLVVGDGDFSFAKGLVAHRGTGKSLVATSYDSESKVKMKYSNAEECINAVVKAGAVVLHDVDATKLQDLSSTHSPPFFHYIVFNFPHSGQQRVHINRILLLDFFISAREKLEERGEVHVSLKTKPPYSNWLIEEQAKKAGLVLKERRPFRIKLFPGYNHRTTDPLAKAFEPDACITYVFIVDRSKFPFRPVKEVQEVRRQRPAVVRKTRIQLSGGIWRPLHRQSVGRAFCSHVAK